MIFSRISSRLSKLVGLSAAFGLYSFVTNNNPRFNFRLHGTVACEDSEHVYSTGQAIGEGLKGELWKSRHENVTVVELENEPFQLVMCELRNKDSSADRFSAMAKLASHILMAHAVSELKEDDETTFITPGGQKMKGNLLGSPNVVVVTIDRPTGSSDCFVDATKDILTGCSSLSLEDAVLRPLSNVFVVVSVMGNTNDISSAVAKLQASRDEKDGGDVVLIVLMAHMNGVNVLCDKFPDLAMIIGGIDITGITTNATLDSVSVPIPGMGAFWNRFDHQVANTDVQVTLAAETVKPKKDIFSWFGGNK